VATQLQLNNIAYDNTVLKQEILKRILLSGFKIGRSIAMILYIATTHEFQIASHPYLD
jgi:hypothetical protein